MRRGRRDSRFLRRGDALDFWRVELVTRPAEGSAGVLRLRAEMRLPGRAWLQFDVEPSGAGQTTIRQTAIFDAAGLSGLAYWYGLYPVHSLVFSRMIRALGRAAEVRNKS
jgi:hypothetical protein